MKSGHLQKVLLTLCCILLWQVSLAQKYTADHLPSHRLQFGSMGGFAGSTEEYTLLKNGQLFYFNSLTKEKKELPPVARKKARAMYKQLKKLNLAKYNIHAPGNMTYFIKEMQRDKTITVEWSDKAQLPVALLRFYEKLIPLKTSS